MANISCLNINVKEKICNTALIDQHNIYNKPHQQKSASTELSKRMWQQKEGKKLQNRVEYCPASSPIPLWHKIMQPLPGRKTLNNTRKAGDIFKQTFRTNFLMPS